MIRGTHIRIYRGGDIVGFCRPAKRNDTGTAAYALKALIIRHRAGRQTLGVERCRIRPIANIIVAAIGFHIHVVHGGIRQTLHRIRIGCRIFRCATGGRMSVRHYHHLPAGLAVAGRPADGGRAGCGGRHLHIYRTFTSGDAIEVNVIHVCSIGAGEIRLESNIGASTRIIGEIHLKSLIYVGRCPIHGLYRRKRTHIARIGHHTYNHLGACRIAGTHLEGQFQCIDRDGRIHRRKHDSGIIGRGAIEIEGM